MSVQRGASESARSLYGSTPTKLLVIALVLLGGYTFALRHSLDFSIDGKTFYLAGKAMIVGGDFYDIEHEKLLSERFAPDGKNAHLFAHSLTHPPITPVIFAPLSLLPWSVFRLVLLAINVGSIPVIAFLCLRFYQRPSFLALWASSVFIALLPSVWQAVKLGQIALPMLASALLAAHFVLRRQPKGIALFALLAMVKPTLCIPLLAYLFVVGKPRERLALLGAGAAYGFLNLLGIARLQMQGISFAESYRQALNLSFGGGGLNNPLNIGVIRLDVEVLLTNLSLVAPKTAKYAIVFLLIGAFWWASRRWLGRENQMQFGAAVSAMLLLGLIMFYHRSYDGVLLLPALFLGISAWWQSLRAHREYSSARYFHLALAVVALLCLAAIGSDGRNALNMILGVVKMSQPWWFKATCVLVCYGLMMIILKLQPTSELQSTSKPPQGELA